MNEHFYCGKRNVLILFLILSSSYLSFIVTALDLGVNNIRGVIIETPIVDSSFNNNTGYVNNSLYWQGHTGTDGSWLTGIGGGNSSWNESMANGLYLNLNQSTPQTITDGQPNSEHGWNMTRDVSGYGISGFEFSPFNQWYADNVGYLMPIITNNRNGVGYSGGTDEPVSAMMIIDNGLILQDIQDGSVSGKLSIVSGSDTPYNILNVYTDSSGNAHFSSSNGFTFESGVGADFKYSAPFQVQNDAGSGALFKAYRHASDISTNDRETGLEIKQGSSIVDEVIAGKFYGGIDSWKGATANSTYSARIYAGVQNTLTAKFSADNNSVINNTIYGATNFQGNVTINQLIKLTAITLPACSSSIINTFGANATGTYGCNSTTWVRLF